MTWLWTASRRSVWVSFAPIRRLNPTMSVNMIAASRRFSPDAALLVSSFVDADYSADVASLSTVHGMLANASASAAPESRSVAEAVGRQLQAFVRRGL